MCQHQCSLMTKKFRSHSTFLLYLMIILWYMHILLANLSWNITLFLLVYISQTSITYLGCHVVNPKVTSLNPNCVMTCLCGKNTSKLCSKRYQSHAERVFLLVVTPRYMVQITTHYRVTVVCAMVPYHVIVAKRHNPLGKMVTDKPFWRVIAFDFVGRQGKKRQHHHFTFLHCRPAKTNVTIGQMFIFHPSDFSPSCVHVH